MEGAGPFPRVAVVILFDGPLARRLEGWRRTYDPAGAYRMPPHVPLAGPSDCPVPLSGTDGLERRLWCLCHDRPPFEIELLDLATTYPEGRLVYVDIGAGAEDLEELSEALRDGVLSQAPAAAGPPRLVVAEPEDEEGARQAAAQLVGLPVRVNRLIDRVNLLVEYPDGSWYVRDFFTLDRAVARA